MPKLTPRDTDFIDSASTRIKKGLAGIENQVARLRKEAA